MDKLINIVGTVSLMFAVIGFLGMVFLFIMGSRYEGSLNKTLDHRQGRERDYRTGFWRSFWLFLISLAILIGLNI